MVVQTFHGGLTVRMTSRLLIRAVSCVHTDNWENYMKVLSAQPIVTKGFTSFSVYLLGDWTAQVSRLPLHFTYASRHMPYAHAYLPNTSHIVHQCLHLSAQPSLLPTPLPLLTPPSHSPPPVRFPDRSTRASRWRRLTAGGWRAQHWPV